MADTDTQTADAASNASADSTVTQAAKPAPVFTKEQYTAKIKEVEAPLVAKVREYEARLAEIEAEKQKAEEAKLSAAQRAELEQKREREKTAAEIAALKNAAAAERTKRHEVLRAGRAASLASTFAASLWTPDLLPHVENAIASRLVIADDGKGGEVVMVQMGSPGDNEPIETALPKLREEPLFKSFLRINGGSGAQHGAAGAKGPDRWASLSPTDRIKAGLSK